MIAALLLLLHLAAPVDAIAPAHGAAAPVAVVASADSVVLTLPEVRIERERLVSAARRRLPTAFVTDLSARSSNRALETLPELIAQAAGVHIDQYGGLGAFSTVSLRGAPPGQVSVYLDGEPLTSASHAVVNLADLPSTAIDRVEIYRGLAPLSLGAATPGGAINLITSASAPLREASITRGSFGTWQGRGSAGASRGALSALFQSGFQSSAGDFPYLDNHGTRFNSADDRVVARANDRFDMRTALGTLRWTPERGTSVLLRENFFQKAQGLPGLGAVPALNARLAYRRALTQIEASRPGAGLTPEARLSAGIDRERSRLRDDGGPLGLGELRIGRHDSDDHFNGEHAAIDLGWAHLPSGLALSSSASTGITRAELKDPKDGYPDPPPSRRLSSGAALSADWRPVGDWLTLHGARRWDRMVDHLRSNGVAGAILAGDVTRSLNSPQLGVRVQALRGIELRANWARASRAPDFLELFGRQGSITGNARLKSESGENRDYGLSWSGAIGRRDLAFEWARFDSRARDLILYWNNSPNTSRADNVASARIRGEEFSVRTRPIAPLAVTAAVTWQSAIDTGPVRAWRGKRLPQRPGREAYARADYTHAALRVSADLQYMGDDFRDRYNADRVPSRTLVGASVSTALRGGARVVVEGKNLGNRRISDVGGYPLPGRSVFVSLELRLGLAGSSP